MRVDIVIVNWQSGVQLADAVGSVALHHQDRVGKVIVVDNASADDSLERLEQLSGLPFELKVIRNSCNRGFAAACNQGAAQATEDLVLFLNPDTRLFDRSLSVPLDFMALPGSSDAGVVGVMLVDEKGGVARTCARFPTLGSFFVECTGLNRLALFRDKGRVMLEWPHDSTRDVDQIMGAFFLVRRDVFRQAGGFDERFFVYFEEVDLSRRLRTSGWRSVHLAGASAFHAGAGTSCQVKAHRLFYFLRSRLFYGFKHFSSAEAWVLVVMTLCPELLIRLVHALFRGGPGDGSSILRAYRMLWGALPDILAGKAKS